MRYFAYIIHAAVLTLVTSFDVYSSIRNRITFDAVKLKAAPKVTSQQVVVLAPITIPKPAAPAPAPASKAAPKPKSAAIAPAKRLATTSAGSSSSTGPGCYNLLPLNVPQNAIKIGVVANNPYLSYTFVALSSIVKHSKPEEREEPLHFDVIVNELNFYAKKQQDLMLRYSKRMHALYNEDTYKYDIRFMPIPERERECISQFNSYKWPQSIFLKLLFSRIFPYDRYLYLDGDILCVNDIRSLWNVNLGAHCIGACDHGSGEIPIYNGGVQLMDLKQMREYKFADECEELAKSGQREGRGRIVGGKNLYTEEDPVREYTEKHPDFGVFKMDTDRFNMCARFLPRKFWKGDTEAVHKYQWLSNLTIIHYEPYKPWSNNFLREYEDAGRPDCHDLNNPFLKKKWRCNQWALWMWLEHWYKEGWCEFDAVK
ncbi:hypothetical protein FACS189449_05940 [Alphaproteobacteria bacterium]|nr:hypothetical protein FACS189449_05940 [Alphaproteobacteria bacterium]